MTTSEAQEYDPFAAFEDVIAGTSRDPWPALAAKRRDAPVSKGLTIPPDVLPEGFSAEPEWIAYRYDDCSRILRDPKTFTSTGYDATIGMVMGHMILGMDDPEHRSHRNLVAHAFREKSLARWEPEFIAPIIDEQIDRFAADGEADLVRQLTFEFPVRVIARLLGLPEEDFPQFHRWSIELIGLVADIDRGLAASESLRDFFAGVVADRRAHPADDVISDLVSAEVDGEKLSDEAIYSFLRLLLPAGAETTYRSSGNLLYLLLTHPEQLAAVQADRALLPQATRGGPALRAAAPDDRSHDHLRRGSGRGADRSGARWSPRTSARPTTTRRVGTTPRASTSSARPSRTSPSPTGRTCASACISPGSRRGCCSTASSTDLVTWPSVRATPTPTSGAMCSARRPRCPSASTPPRPIPGGAVPAHPQPTWRASTSFPRATKTVATIDGGNSPCETRPGTASSRSDNRAGSPTSPW